MAIMDCLRQARRQMSASWNDIGFNSREITPKDTGPVIASIPVSPGTPDTPETLRYDTTSTLESPLEKKHEIRLEMLPQQSGRLRSWKGSLILIVTSGSQFLDNVFMTSSNMALASIQEEFQVSNTNLQWMISAYTLAFGGFLLLAGFLSDR